MAIVPCSMKTLAGVAHGLSRNLVERAADVMLKEQRRLVIVPRETPMSLPQLRNMVLCAEAGAMILPAMPAFYQQPRTIDDLADFVAGKILSALGFEHDLYQPWTGRIGVGTISGPWSLVRPLSLAALVPGSWPVLRLGIGRANRRCMTVYRFEDLRVWQAAKNQ